ncbi:MAG: DNA polymerase III subunit beta [Fimbriimonadaceae bacterium]|nr:DNA polymerase III subunit beta [Fimbriimonadaceae bacterium]QYK55515.1 MAG: DNA polymerase III subunit beta [Fimbriimonadaceae bacterium]
MKVTVPRKELSQALAIAGSASSLRSPHAVLQAILIDAEGAQIALTGCDGEMWAKAVSVANVQESGSVCVQARLLSEIVNALPEGSVDFEISGTTVLMKHGQSEWKLLALPAEEFPPIPEVEEQSQLTLTMGDFTEAVESVIFAVSDDLSRAFLTGVLFNYDGALLTMVATDTHRLAVNRLHREGIGSPLNVIVPEKALKTIKTLPVAADDPVTIRFDDTRLMVDVGTAKIVAQLLNGQYPNWERVVPAEFTRTWTIDRTELHENVKRAMILAKDNANRVRFSGVGDKVVISARSEDRGEAKEEVAIISKNGDMEIAFNGRYIMDALSAIPGDGIVAQMTEPSRPAVIRPIENGEDRFCVVMPMALG